MPTFSQKNSCLEKTYNRSKFLVPCFFEELFSSFEKTRNRTVQFSLIISWVHQPIGLGTNQVRLCKKRQGGEYWCYMGLSENRLPPKNWWLAISHFQTAPHVIDWWLVVYQSYPIWNIPRNRWVFHVSPMFRQTLKNGEFCCQTNNVSHKRIPWYPQTCHGWKRVSQVDEHWWIDDHPAQSGPTPADLGPRWWLSWWTEL